MSQNKKVIEAIYVELDALLDTRLSTIARLDDAAATRALKNGYHTRVDDHFEGIDVPAYRDLYQKRDIVTLAGSVATDMLKLLRHLVGVLAEQAIARPYHDGSKIVVNLYPYRLSKEEQEEIGRAVFVWMEGIAPVELVFITPNDLTPSHCKNAYSMMIVYEYENWMNLHAAAFEHTRLPQVTMFVPALYFGKTPTPAELEQAIKEAAHPMRALELLASSIIELKLIDIKYFSILSKD